MAKIKQGDIVRVKNSEKPEAFYCVYAEHENNPYIVYVINCEDAVDFATRGKTEPHGSVSDWIAGQWLDVSLLKKVSK